MTSQSDGVIAEPVRGPTTFTVAASTPVSFSNDEILPAREVLELTRAPTPFTATRRHSGVTVKVPKMQLFQSSDRDR